LAALPRLIDKTTCYDYRRRFIEAFYSRIGVLTQGIFLDGVIQVTMIRVVASQ